MEILPTSCDIHDQQWLSNTIFSYKPNLGKDICNIISSLVVVRYNCDINEKKWVEIENKYFIKCSSLCPHYFSKNSKREI